MQTFTMSAEEEQGKKTKKREGLHIDMIVKLRFYMIS